MKIMMRSVSVAAMLAISIGAAAAPAKKSIKKADECGSLAQSVVAAHSMADDGVRMFDAIERVRGGFIRDKVPAAKIEEYMANVRDIITAGYMAHESGLSQSTTYQAFYDGCMNTGQRL